MIKYSYNKSHWKTFPQGQGLEWVLTNGLGGYAGSTLINAHHRTHQGYLIAALHPPTERYLLLSKINEKITVDKSEYDLTTAIHKGGVISHGEVYLTSVTYDNASITHTYAAGPAILTRHIALVRGENRCNLTYKIKNEGSAPVSLTLTPLFNFREHNANVRPEELNFTLTQEAQTLTLVPEARPDLAIVFSTSIGNFTPRTDLFDVDMALPFEQEQEVDGLDCHFTPYDIEIEAKGEAEVIVECCLRQDLATASTAAEATTTVTRPATTATEATATASDAQGIATPQFNYVDPFAQALCEAANHFICDRVSTGTKTILAGLPWFTDWGRDTMIAFTGLTLCTHRFDEAAEILLTFARYIRNGIVPNMFPDDGAEPFYNTADASLWYFYAVERYLTYVNTPEAHAFIEKEIYPSLKEILAAYEHGTENSIYMDIDGLIHAGSGLDQVTWMDVRVGEWVVTPRHGKPVEINALWYNALRVAEQLAIRYEGPESATAIHCSELAALVENNFNQRFWWPERACLYDVVDGEDGDRIRPNQIYAVSLPYTCLPADRQAAVVKTVKDELYVGCGLRSLSTDHPDYQGAYVGALSKRDAAYHQGTAWGFLLGGFLTAYVKVHGHSDQAKADALDMLRPIREHLHSTGCIGSINEIFDGDGLHTPRGCYAQAWSVGDTLRAYVEDIM